RFSRDWSSDVCSSDLPTVFSDVFLDALKVVEKHYAALFEQAPELGSSSGNLVFTGDVDDPGTLETLAAMGYERPSDICRVIRTRSEERRVGKECRYG